MKIKEFRRSQGLTQEELGKLVGASNVSISLYERGEQSPDIEMLKKLATALNTSVDALLDHNQQQGEEEWDFREKVRNDPNFRLLFREAKTSKPEALRAAAAVLHSLKGEPDAD